MPSPWPLGAGLFWIFIALLCGWLAWFYPRTGGRTIAVASAHQPRSMTPTEARLWLILWIVMGLSLVGIAVTIMRHAQGRHVVIPASAPFIDHLIWVGSWVCSSGAFCVFVAWSFIGTAQGRREWRERRERRARRQHSGDS